MSIKKDIIAILVGILIFILLFGSVYTVKIPAPDFAVVYVDQEKKIYYAPPYVDKLSKPAGPAQTNIDVKKLKASTIKEMRDLKYTPDGDSREKGYFVQNYRSFTGYLMEKAGLAKPLPSRWNKDGAWNW